MKTILLTSPIWLLAGCAAAMPLATIKVPVPIECRVDEPERPVMPTEALQAGDPLDTKVLALLAETELREGYEIQLVAALRTCKKPIVPR